MTREELDRRNAAALTRHYRTWTDNAGQAPRGLLDDLARVADEHAASVIAEHPGPIVVTEVPPADAPGPRQEPARDAGTQPPSATAPRRTAARTARGRAR